MLPTHHLVTQQTLSTPTFFVFLKKCFTTFLLLNQTCLRKCFISLLSTLVYFNKVTLSYGQHKRITRFYPQTHDLNVCVHLAMNTKKMMRMEWKLLVSANFECIFYPVRFFTTLSNNWMKKVQMGKMIVNCQSVIWYV